METPSAVISGAMRELSRRGLKATRSMRTPSTPEPKAAAANIRTSASATGTVSAPGPPSPVRTKSPMNAPIMYTSPCAKFSRPMTP